VNSYKELPLLLQTRGYKYIMSTKKPFFTVIMPIYNKAPHLARSIKSVINQTFDNIEIIIVNDASNDDSMKEVQRFSDLRIRIFHRNKPGPGGYAARNLGIKKARGEWLTFIDADDKWLSDHLQNMFELSKQFPECDFLSCGWKNVFENQLISLDPFSEQSPIQEPREISFVEYLELCIKRMQPTWTGVACLRNDEIAKNIFPAGRAYRGGDLYAWVKYLSHIKKMAWSPHIGAYYYRNSVNMVTKKTIGDIEFVKILISDIAPQLENENSRILIKYCNRLICQAWKASLLNEPKKTVNLNKNLSWKGDYLYCTLHFALSLFPLNLLRIALKMKINILNQTILILL